MSPKELADKYMKPYKLRNKEINPIHCPFCGSQTKDKYKFYMNKDTGTYLCHRANCGVKGSFIDLLKHFGEWEDNHLPDTDYSKYNKKINEPSKKIIDYLKLRNLSEKTIKERQIGEVDGNIAFPFYDQKHDLQLLKYRPAKKIKNGDMKSWAEPGGKGVLFGMNLCDPSKPLVITEGELDSCSLTEAGVENSVSVPNGAKDFSWVDNCWSWLKQFDKIIIFGDNDKNGREMTEKVVKKLGEERCSLVFIDDRENIKDANELLYYEGKEAVLQAVETAEPAPVEGLIDLSEVVPIEQSDMPKVLSKFHKLDKTIGGFYLGELSIWTGKRREGKSTLLSQILLEAVNDGVGVCAYSGELTAIRFQNWIHKQLAGEMFMEKTKDKETGKDFWYLPREIHDKIRKWYKGRFFLYDNTISFDSVEESSIIRIFTYAAKRYDCKVFLVDNLMTAPMRITQERNYFRRQGLFVGELARFAKSFNVHVHLVAHPSKASEDNVHDINDIISGSSEIPDRADNIFQVKRTDEGEFDTILKVTKNRAEGIQDYGIGLMFDEVSKRFFQPSDPDSLGKIYNWVRDEDLPPFSKEAPWDF